MIDTEKLDKLQKYSRVIAALSLTIFFALIVISFWSLYRVRNEITDLRKEASALEEKRQSLTEQITSTKGELQSLEAQRTVLSQTISEIAKQHPDSVKRAINQATAELPDKPVISQENKRIEYTKQVIEQLVQAAPSVARNLTRIYLQITDQKQRPRALRIAGQLKQAGYLVPPIEDVSDQDLRIQTQVRYYAKASDAEKEEAQKIRNLLREWGIKAETRAIKDHSKPWQYEIWFGSDFD